MSKLAQLRALRETQFEEMSRKTKTPSASAKVKKPRAKTKTVSARVAPTMAVNEQPKTRGRPTAYRQELADEVCERLASGETLRQICRSEHMPDERTVRRWYIDDVNGFSPQYARARDLQLETWADEIIEIGDDGSNDWMLREQKDGEGTAYAVNGEHVSRSRLRVDNRKWLLSKLKPKVYGEGTQRLEVGKPGEFAKLDDMSDAELADIARGGSGRTAPQETGPARTSGVH